MVIHTGINISDKHIVVMQSQNHVVRGINIRFNI